jgi:hypothetical protein
MAWLLGVSLSKKASDPLIAIPILRLNIVIADWI